MVNKNMNSFCPTERKDYDSDEEFAFYFWLKEAQEHGLIERVRYQPRTFELSPRQSVFYQKKLKVKYKRTEKFLFYPHVYTPDFDFWIIDDCMLNTFVSSRFLGTKKILIDVKGVYAKHDSKSFPINQKWMFDNYGYYVEKIIPKRFFKKTYVPEACRFTPVTKKLAQPYLGVDTIDQFLDKNKGMF